MREGAIPLHPENAQNYYRNATIKIAPRSPEEGARARRPSRLVMGGSAKKGFIQAAVSAIHIARRQGGAIRKALSELRPL